jgi:hypothetical protein
MIKNIKDLLEFRTYELQQELQKKQNTIVLMNKNNDDIREENKNLFYTIEKCKKIKLMVWIIYIIQQKQI